MYAPLPPLCQVQERLARPTAAAPLPRVLRSSTCGLADLRLIFSLPTLRCRKTPFKFSPGDVVSTFVATVPTEPASNPVLNFPPGMSSLRLWRHSQQSQPAPSVFRCPCPPWLDRQPCLSRPRQHYDICIFLAMAEAAMPKLRVRRNRHPLPNELQFLVLTASQGKKYVGIAIS